MLQQCSGKFIRVSRQQIRSFFGSSFSQIRENKDRCSSAAISFHPPTTKVSSNQSNTHLLLFILDPNPLPMEERRNQKKNKNKKTKKRKEKESRDCSASSPSSLKQRSAEVHTASDT
jgi:hypothetical protein